MLILTVPEGVTADLIIRSRATRMRVTTTMTAIEARMVFVISQSSYSAMPMKVMKAMPIRPTVMNVMPRPLRASGTLE